MAGASIGESRIAAKDGVIFADINTYVYLTNTAMMKCDTTIVVGSDMLSSTHIRIGRSAVMTIGGTITISGNNVADTYISGKYGTTLWDYFRSSSTSTSPNNPAYNFKARGYSKIMAGHN